MKKFIMLICILGFSTTSYGAGSAQANTAGIKEGINSAANGAYAASKIPKCPKSGTACAQAAAGFMQLIKSLMDMMGSMGGRDSLAPDYDWSNPGFGDDFGTINPGDQDYFNPIIDAVEKGNYDDYKNAHDQLLKKAGAIEKSLNDAGYSVDKNTGILTGPNGAKTDLATMKIDDGQSISDYMNKASGALDMSGGGGMIAADGSGAGGANGGYGLGSDSDGLGSGSGKGVDDFLNKLKNGNVDDKLSGMSKTTNEGDKIGVAMNNIFKMIQVKYTNIDKNKEFMNK